MGKNFWGGVARFLKNFNRVIFACDISYKADIAPTVVFPHQGLGCVIGDGVTIEDNTIVRQNVTIGGRNVKGEYKYPHIGKSVDIGTGAVILGDIRIGNNVRIGANAVVIADIPSDVTAVGIPAEIKKLNERKEEKDTGG